MARSTKHKIVILGCGNLAWHLANQFHQLGFPFTVYNHQKNPALAAFAQKFKCKIKPDLKQIEKDADHYFICVSDQFVSSVSNKIKQIKTEALVLHCSGSLPLEAIEAKHKQKAVFYPIQTFSKKDNIIWSEVPVLLEASNAKALTQLKDLAKLFTATTHFADSKKRLSVHLAAVLANNFTNALYVSALHMMQRSDKKADFKLLLPLVKQSVKKLGLIKPLEAQTGPAKRKDTKVQKKHLKLLKDETELKKLYKLMSRLIVKQQKQHA